MVRMLDSEILHPKIRIASFIEGLLCQANPECDQQTSTESPVPGVY